ncbi:GntR family transcriptional regulator [Arthrobacter sp. LAPM80]|uniref:GntR family transcriptional regulator n=1 Tax=Arthrobacter sp. LAPM80 TaxID=3141788 RepID=UPI00398B0E9D
MGATETKQALAGSVVAQKLRASIMNGELRPGAKLSETSLGAALGVSRNTLREAFTVLGAERIITRIPNRGVFVARPSAADVREMYRIRRVLEPAALLQPASPKEAAQALADAVQQGLAARERHDVAAMAAANQQFHARVVALAQSPRLDALMAHVQAEMRLVFHTMADDPGFHAPFSVENARIFSLWSDGQAATAAVELGEYLDTAQAQVLAAMPAERDRSL